MYLKEHSEIILLKSFNKDLLELGTGGAGINFMTFIKVWRAFLIYLALLNIIIDFL